MAGLCTCAQLAAALRGDTHSPPAIPLAEVPDKTADWLELRHCTVCGQSWQLDLPDRLQVTLAIKIADPNNWPVDDSSARRQYLVERRGISNARCLWRDCQRNALNKLAYCDEHAWEMGLRD
jgi:hypothetical protein